MTVLQIIFWATVMPLLLLAILFGEREEKIGMSLIVGGSLATTMMTLGKSYTYANMAPMIFFADTMFLLAFIKLAFSSQKYWPLWVASLQLITVMTHLIQMLLPGIVPKAYAMIQGFWVYPMCISIAFGIYGVMIVRRRQIFDI